MKSDFRAAIAQIAAERGLSKETIMEVLESALKAAYRRSNTAAANQNVRVDLSTGEVKVFVMRTVVEEVEDDEIEISIEDVRRLSSRFKVGDVYEEEDVKGSRDFGRIAAQTFKQVLLQGFREKERDHVYEQFMDREGDIINGTIQRLDPKGITIELEPKAEALMPPPEQVNTERYRPGQKIKVFLVEVQKSHRGPQLIVSRTHRNLLRRLFEIEVPEIFNGTVEIKSIAREPGLRSKVAVTARQEGVDPVGSCVGMRGVRIQNIVNELYGEKIDVLPWDSDMAKYIANALSPAQVVRVDLDDLEKSALVLVPQNQLSLAIGKEGQNARLAAKLTGWRIDIKPVTAGAVVAAAINAGNRNVDEDAFTRLARAALSRQEERESSLNTSFAKAARAAGLNFDDLDETKEPAEQPEGLYRKVRPDGTFTYNGITLGPLPPHLANQTISLQDNGKRLLVLWGDELIRSFRADDYNGSEELVGSINDAPQERENRKVRKDRMIVFRNQTYGPLPEQYAGQTVELQLISGHLDVYDGEDLIDSFLWDE
ncbi:MAG: transcription termination factor NusA [Chloroflexota bacterium]|nr:transcription termination/antitermination protein NusA [Chloroflexota bacterium]